MIARLSRFEPIALTKAGAWIYDINNQEKQYLALERAYSASSALLSPP